MSLITSKKLLNKEEASTCTEPCEYRNGVSSETLKKGSLGINTKSADKKQYVSLDNGETRNLIINKKTGSLEVQKTIEDNMFLKYYRLSSIRKMLFDTEKRDNYKKTQIYKTKEMVIDETKELGFKYKHKKENAQHRTFHCHYDLSKINIRKNNDPIQSGKLVSRNTDKAVSIYQHNETKKVFTSGQFICSSVWTCPVCASKITEKKRVDLETAFNVHRLNGGGVYETKDNKIETKKKTKNGIYLMTLTIPHYKKDNLKQLMNQLKEANRIFKKTRIYTDSLKEHKFLGEIRALEITYSNANGWHPHFHSLLFFNQLISKGEMEELKADLLGAWQSSCVKAGLNMPSQEHGLDIRDGSQADKYVNKWGMQHEITKWTSKSGRAGSVSPFQIADLYIEETDKSKKSHYKYLFNEYATAFKGFRQLFWSRGLKSHFGIVEKTDEELTEETTEQAIFLGSLSEEDWKLIRKTTYINPLTSQLIPFVFGLSMYVQKNGYQSLIDYINNLKNKIDDDDNPFILNVDI